MRMYQYDKRLDFHALGREIKRQREAKGWTQDYLAQLVNRPPARPKTIFDWSPFSTFTPVLPT